MREVTRFTGPYINPETGILFNLFNAKTSSELKALEYKDTWRRRLELEKFPVNGVFDLQHLREIHYRLFQDVYPWAGQFRNVMMKKGATPFVEPPAFSFYGKRLEELVSAFKLPNEKVSDEVFAYAAAEVLALINFIHPFREGNGRTQRAFIDQIAKESNKTLSWRNVSEQEHLRASIMSANSGNGAAFLPVFQEILKPPLDGLSILDDGLYVTSSDENVETSSFKPKADVAKSFATNKLILPAQYS